MKAAESAKDFVASPVGTYFALRTFILCAPSAERMIVTHMASLDPSEVATVAELVGLPGSPGLAPTYDVIYDVSQVAAMDRASFTLFEAYVRTTIEHVAVRTRKFALVRPPGLSGHMFTGMAHDWLVPRLGERLKMFSTRDDAFGWLDVPAAERTSIESAVDAFDHATPVIRQLRDLLARDLRVSSLETVATRIGTSPRSLQRHLSENGTSFRDELARVRIRAAQALLVDTDHKIEAIAAELGFRSVAAFTTMFRSAVGDTPVAYRESRRRP